MHTNPKVVDEWFETFRHRLGREPDHPEEINPEAQALTAAILTLARNVENARIDIVRALEAPR